jgi:hypothetical protein
MRGLSPIFIVGSPRSGTTLLRNMLNRHPAIAICLETQFSRLIYARRRAFGDLSDLRKRERLVKEYLSTERVKRMQMDLPALEERLLREGVSCEAFFTSFLRFYAEANGKRRCGEKTPGHALFLGTLCQWYPDAFIIHILRDPRDVVASLVRMPSKPKNVLANADVWVRLNLGAWRARQYPRYLPVRYEELAMQPEEEIRRICAFIGEEYSSSMLVASPDWQSPNAWHRRAQEPVTTARLGKWREYLTAEQVALIEWKVGPHMQRFGYEPVGCAPSSLSVGRELMKGAVDSLTRHIGEFPAAWYSLIRSPNISREEAARGRFRRHVAFPTNP